MLPEDHQQSSGIQYPHRPIHHQIQQTQGFPLAPLLYVIYLEPFLQKIRSTLEILGYQMSGAQGERLITTISTDSCFIAKATKVLDHYCAATGALVNKSNSELFLSQDWQETLPLFLIHHQAAGGHLPKGRRWLHQLGGDHPPCPKEDLRMEHTVLCNEG